jgi:membrane protease YdiL (CAAX protease family)
LVFSALTAGITEELIFRAYIMPRLLIFFKNAYLPIVVSALFFGLMHVSYGTLMQVLGPFYIGVIFGIYYYKFRNIKVLIVCHFLWDLIALLVKTR